MAEVAVEFIKGEKYLTWYSDDYYTVRHMRKLCEDYPDDVQIISDDEESMLIHAPISWFREPKPKTKRVMTEEQRAAAAERLRLAREKSH